MEGGYQLPQQVQTALVLEILERATANKTWTIDVFLTGDLTIFLPFLCNSIIL